MSTSAILMLIFAVVVLGGGLLTCLKKAFKNK